MKLAYRLLLFVLVLFAVTGTAAADSGEREFEARLTGEEEVPNPVSTDTEGRAKFEVNSNMTEIHFELKIEDATDILGAAGAHIHCAPKGENGPVVAFLAPEFPGGLDGDVQIEATLTDANIVNKGTGCGASIAALVEAMRDGKTYVNVHSLGNPSGEVRGQIEED